jgi:hypothetical protein
MAMTTQDTTFDAADLAPISTASSLDQLDEAMDVARIAANAQRDLEAAGENPLDAADEEKEAPEEDEQDGESTTGSPAEEAQESEDASTDEEEVEEEPEEEPAPASTPQQQPQPTYSRRDAARFKSELDTARTELQTLRGQVNSHRSSDASIIQQIAEQAGSEPDFQALAQKNNLGQASDQERQKLAIMQQWRQVAGPIYRTAQQQVFNQWAGAYQAASQYDGVTPEAAQAIMNAVDPAAALQTIHAAGMTVGADKARQEFKDEQKKVQAENQRLKAELSSVKSKQVAAKPQPATPDGSSPAAMPKLPPMFLEDGSTLNPDFEKLASSGKLYGVDKLTG